MDCCENQEEIKVDNMFVCKNCDSLLDNIEFETTLFSNETRNNIRYNKFFKLIVSTPNLPWYVRNSMLDFFPKIERYFLDSERINFINMNQLAREMCRVLDYPECVDLFPALKTKARVKQVSKFVDNACRSIGGYSGVFWKMEDIPMKSISCGEIDMRKIPNLDHVYTDKLLYGRV